MIRNKTNIITNDLNQSIQFKILNEKQCSEIVDAAFKILADTGCHVKNAEALQIFTDAGCFVDGNSVKIPTALIRKCLKTVPDEIIIYDRDGNPSLKLGSHTGNSYFVPGMCNIYRFDVETGERRLAVLKDTFDAGLLVDALPNIDVACGLALISDCTPTLSCAYEVRQLLESTTKPILIMTTNKLEIETTLKMCAEVAGGMDKFKEKPFAIAGASSTSPLTHNDENLDTLIYMFKAGIPTPYIAAPMIGASAPVTLSGALSVGIADNLVGLVLSQLVNPGTPFMGSCFIDYMDMATMSFAMTTPEIALGSAASVDIYRYLNIPCVCHLGTTDSPIFDQQAALDIAVQIYTAMLSGSNLNFFSGFLETAMSGSLEAIVYANDTIDYLNRIIGGIEVSDETLALDVIDEVGPGGNFLGEIHTLEHYHENWIPGTMTRMKWQDWKNAESKDYKARANEKVKSIIKKGVVKPLSSETLTKLDSIMAEAKAKAHK